ncbi:hypothetical protein CRG98_037597 [Punica granatum]|uniref:Integrase catalytic domain-containing protein n=1 Tax=Punica granatum TaxID=22663 RepID=A0A2I0IDC5_PUNGR|nr:hypothetical protein CRG98_037597 [Punica granatum]
MAVVISMKSMNPLSCILNDNRLTGPNFLDWFRKLNIVLIMEALGYILETQEIELPGGDATSDQHDAYDQCKTGKKNKKSKKGYVPQQSAGVSKNKGKAKGLASSRILRRNEVYLKIGNGASVVAKAVGEVARGGYSYFITFTDDYSRFGYIYLMKYKHESFEKFKEFKAEVEKQKGKSIKTLRSDRGGEYMSTEFGDFLKEHGIVSQFTPPGTPQLNGVSERRNSTLLDMVRSMMSYTDLSISMWGYALQTACYLLNRIPSKSISTTPYEIWNGRTPSLKHVKIWGCPAFTKKQKTDKLETRSEKGRFVGYPSDRLGYYFYFPIEQRVVISRDVIFLEKQFVQEGGMGRQIVLDGESSVPKTDQEPISIDTDKPVETSIQIENVTEPRRSGRVTHIPARYLNLHDHRDDLTTYEEAISDIDSFNWLEAMKSEMDSMSKKQE